MKILKIVIFIILYNISFAQEVVVKKVYQDPGNKKSGVIYEYEVLKSDTSIKYGFFKAYFEGTEYVSEEGQYKDNLKEGEWFRYFESEIKDIKESANFKNGQLDGDYYFFHSPKVLAEKGRFMNGGKIGKWWYYDSEGILDKTVLYTYNKESIKYYYQNGTLQINEIYSNGLKDGIWTYYDKSGQLISKLNYLNGKLHDTSYSYINGNQLFGRKIFDEGKLISAMYLDSLGGIYRIDTMMRDEGIRIEKIFHQNGKVFSICNFRDSTLLNCTQYDTFGNLLDFGNYKNGTGEQKLYYNNGNIFSKINYLDGLKSGFCNYYTSEGKLYQSMFFDNNNKIKDSIYLKNVEFNFEPYFYSYNKPKYPGGDEGFKNYLLKNLHYPDFAKENDIQGTVLSEFVIYENGIVVFSKIIKSLGKYLDNEVMRLISKMSRYEFGTLHGFPIKVSYKMPVRFELH